MNATTKQIGKAVARLIAEPSRQLDYAERVNHAFGCGEFSSSFFSDQRQKMVDQKCQVVATAFGVTESEAYNAFEVWTHSCFPRS